MSDSPNNRRCFVRGWQPPNGDAILTGIQPKIQEPHTVVPSHVIAVKSAMSLENVVTVDPLSTSTPIVPSSPPQAFPPIASPSGSKEAKRNWAPRPRNQFIIFRCEYSRKHTREGKRVRRPVGSHPDKTLSKRAGDAWKGLSEAQKKKYKDLAEREKVEHERAYPGYHYTPRRGFLNQRGSRASQPRQKVVDTPPDDDDFDETTSTTTSQQGSPSGLTLDPAPRIEELRHQRSTSTSRSGKVAEASCQLESPEIRKQRKGVQNGTPPEPELVNNMVPSQSYDPVPTAPATFFSSTGAMIEDPVPPQMGPWLQSSQVAYPWQSTPPSVPAQQIQDSISVVDNYLAGLPISSTFAPPNQDDQFFQESVEMPVSSLVHLYDNIEMNDINQQLNSYQFGLASSDPQTEDFFY